MREVEVSQFVAAPPTVVARVLTPRAVVAAEGSFDVREIATDGPDDETLVRAGRRGLSIVFAFEEQVDGVRYVQREGPLDELTTTITYRSENEGTRLTARSELSVGPSLVERAAAWKRRGELKRALRTLAEEC
ncbi:SRPBCC family protein [Halomarina salina]|uniref:SRPBCC family protein n=1 Tax=Halomarina salina TaxID=1872699 RepID=A0ABD5RN53_9EURY|nr:SRPBCC family protein [Halomarina salina]